MEVVSCNSAAILGEFLMLRICNGHIIKEGKVRQRNREGGGIGIEISG